MASASTPRVLLVSDSQDEREMYAESLRRNGFCTLQADTAADGYRLAAELLPSAVVTDIRLAGYEDGLTLTRRIKTDDTIARVPVVVLTGDVFIRHRAAAQQAGCDVFLSKPCLPDALSKVVAGLLERRS
jgi:CheY-like chemotaxis protein